HGVSQAAFGNIDSLGSLVYGLSFLINGPLADRFGGRRAILLAAGGALAANALLGVLWLNGAIHGDNTYQLALLFSLNMYFQSFGAVAIVKVNASWFHLRERGTFGGIFGILISLGLYFAFDWGGLIARTFGALWVFYAPAILLLFWFAVDFVLVHDAPSATGHADFDTGDAHHGGAALLEVVRRMLSSRVILTIAAVEFCSGF